MQKKYSPIINEFTTKRGHPKFIFVLCSKCQKPIFVYQKDGSGPLKRCYLDRIHESLIEVKEEASILKYPECERKLGCVDNYEKENRLAIYWFTDCIETQDLIEKS